jgi:hypothetical protein
MLPVLYSISARSDAEARPLLEKRDYDTMIAVHRLTKIKPHHRPFCKRNNSNPSPSKQQPTLSISAILQAATPPSMRRVPHETEPCIPAPPDESRCSWTPSAARREQDAPPTVLGPNDIICGRCSTAFNNVGNRRFRARISLYLQRYNEAKSREDKGDAIMSVVRLLLDDIGARFLKKRGNNIWVELGEKQAREKVGHALRDMSVQGQPEQRERRACPITPITKKNKEQSRGGGELVELSSSEDLPTMLIQQHHVEENKNSSTMLLLERIIAPVDTPLDLTLLDSLDVLLDLYACDGEEDELSLDE